MRFKYLIVDDEPLARKLIASHASKIEGLELVGECADAIQANNYLRHSPVDLIFLDIQMPEIDGLQFIGTLRNPPSIIFTTAFRDFAPEAFELDAVDYLLKPISFDRLLKAVNKFFGKKSNSLKVIEKTDPPGFLYLKAERKVHKISLADIIFIESLDEYVKVHLENKILVTKESISTLAQKLSKRSFIRIHRSFIISNNFVRSISSDGVDVAGKQLPFGRTYKLSALAALGVQSKG
jgi:DNA-binding LytR/AlgR family response regulator